MATQNQVGGSGDQSQRGGSVNFANDPERASEANKKGGEHSHGGLRQQDQSGSGR
jgi:general stress protein YciG